MKNRKKNAEILRLYAVTDRSWTGRQSLLQQVESALKGGATCIQLREKELDDETYLREAIQMKELCSRYGVPLIINDRPDIALKSGADGVHVGLEDMSIQEARKILGEGKIIGASAHNVEEALMAQRAGADYLGVGAVFGSVTKKDAKPLSHNVLRAICDAVEIPVAAIGGITSENLDKLQGIGIDGVAVISAVFAAEDIEKQTAALLRQVQDNILTSEPETQHSTSQLYPVNGRAYMKTPDSRMRTVLTIAGSDSSGGAGIQADIKTITMQGAYAMSAITALTAQNTTGVRGIQEVTPEFLGLQLEAVFEDIFPDAVKIGMVSSAELIGVIADRLRKYRPRHIVADPVMVATSGARLLQEGAQHALQTVLLPMAELITPNIPEAEILADCRITDKESMQKAALQIAEKLGCAVLLKGGHSIQDADDLLYDGKEFTWFEGRRIDNPNTHGTGCTLSSAIASNLAKDYPVKEAVRLAKEYISDALSANLNLGKGSGPLMHNFVLHKYRS